MTFTVADPAVTIDPAAYTGQSHFETLGTHAGVTTFTLAAGSYRVRVGSSNGFVFTFAAGGTVTTDTPAAVATSGGTMTFHTVDVVIEPGAYTGHYTLPTTFTGDFTGPRTFVFVPAVDHYRVLVGNTNGFTFVTDAAGNPDPTRVDVPVDGGVRTFYLTPFLAPTVAISGAATATAGSPFTLNLSATGGDEPIDHRAITWGDGTLQTVAGNPSSVTHTYAAAGSFTITAAATNDDGTFPAGNSVVVAPVSGPAGGTRSWPDSIFGGQDHASIAQRCGAAGR